MGESKIIQNTETTTIIDEMGNQRKTVIEKTSKFTKNEEPDYIKIYTKMWCEFNDIPLAYRELFFQLALRMSYCKHTTTGISGQIVNTGGSWKREIMETLGWTSNSMYQRGLQVLCNCNAIRKIGRGEYQINPQYASKGEWKYNPKRERGGVEDLIATFEFKNRKVDTTIVWADDGTDDPLNDVYREGLDTTASDNTVVKTTDITNNDA